MIPLLSPERQNEKLSGQLEKALTRALSHPPASEINPEVAALESEMASRTGFNFAIGLASLPDSLGLALRALGLVAGDEVVVPAYGYSAAAQAVLWAGMTPVFADTCPHTGLLTGDTLRTAVTKKTRAVIALDLYGRRPALAKLREVCDYYGLFLVEECTHAPGLPLAGVAGQNAKPHIAVTGFGPDTPVSVSGFAAVACCSDTVLAQRLRSLSRAAHVGKFSESRVATRSQLDPFQAALLRTKLTQWNIWLAMRRTIAGWYQKALYPYTHPNRLRLTAPVESPELHAWTYFPLRVAAGREALRRHLLARKIAADVLFVRPLPQVPPFDSLGPARRYPGAELWCQEILLLPTFAELTTQEVENVIGSVTEWMNQSSTWSSTNP